MEVGALLQRRELDIARHNSRNNVRCDRRLQFGGIAPPNPLLDGSVAARQALTSGHHLSPPVSE